MFVPQFVIAIPVGKFSRDWPSHKAQGWTSVAVLLFYMLGDFPFVSSSKRCCHLDLLK
jgi:hypothetical protein